MEYFKKCLSSCLEKCCTNCMKRKDSSSSVQIILPTSRKSTSSQGLLSKSTFTYLAQPEFHIPLTSSSSNIEKRDLSAPPTRRKSSAPPVLTRPSMVQPMPFTQAHSIHTFSEPQITIEEDTLDVEDNKNNNSISSYPDSMWKSTDSVHSPSSPSRPPLVHQKRLSVAACHSRRSSMSSFDISKDEVDSDMYESGELSHDVNSNGKLCFTVNYDYEFEQLTITVISAKNLWNSEQNLAVSDSFVKVAIQPQLKKKPTKNATATHKGTPNPRYDEVFTMDGISAASLALHSVKLAVFTLDKYSRRRRLGMVQYRLDQHLQLEDQTRRIWRHVYGDGNPQKEGEQGNLMLTMCYQPTDGQLTVNVVKATQLLIAEQEKPYEGVYTKVALIAHGKIIQKEKTKIFSPAVPDPVFDETFTFTLASSMIDQSCVIVSVCGKTSGGRRAHIGYVSLGPPFFSTGTGLEQWTRMLSVPFSKVGKWHSLSIWSKKDSSHNLSECNMF